MFTVVCTTNSRWCTWSGCWTRNGKCISSKSMLSEYLKSFGSLYYNILIFSKESKLCFTFQDIVNLQTHGLQCVWYSVIRCYYSTSGLPYCYCWCWRSCYHHLEEIESHLYNIQQLILSLDICLYSCFLKTNIFGK